MRLFEVASVRPLNEKKLGRAFNHLEDFVFFYGSEGAVEAIQHLREIGTEKGAKTVRMKWDGKPTVYWGRENAGDPLIVTGSNGWGRGVKTTSPKELFKFIAQGSGTAGKERDAFGKQFASLYPLLDAATPKDFVGFVYGDLMYFSRPELDNEGVYNFCPNEYSGTCYHVRNDSELGKRIAQSDAMIVGHGEFDAFGAPQDEQRALDDFSMFNQSSKLIVLGPVYNKKPVKIDTSALDRAEKYAKQYGKKIDQFLAGTQGLSDLKEIIYRFVNQTSKAKKLDQLSGKLFYEWLADSKVSAPKQQKIAELDKAAGSITNNIFELVKMLQDVKDSVIDQIEGQDADIWDTKGEGHVRYGNGKKFGNIKLVPRKRWQPPV